MSEKRCLTPEEAVDEYFDILIKSRFIEMFGHIPLNEMNNPEFTLGEICRQITDGSHYSPVDEPDGLYPMLSVKDIHEGTFDYVNCKRIGKEAYEKLVRDGCKPLKNDVLIAKDGSVFQKSVVVTEESNQVILSSIAILRPDSNKVNPIFLEHYLMSDDVREDAIRNYTTGTAIRRIILKNLTRMKVMVPEIELQNKFADYVKQVDRSKAICMQILQSFDNLVKSRFIEMFGKREDYCKKWMIKSFNGCCEVMYGFPFDSALFNEEGRGTRLIRIRDINTGPSDTYTTECVDERYLIKNGDLLVSMDGDFQAIIWNSGSALLNQRTCRMNGRPGVVDDAFLLHYLQQELDIIHSRTSATTVKHLSAKEINRFSVPVPPLTIQKQFADFVRQVDKSKFTGQCNTL